MAHLSTGNGLNTDFTAFNTGNHTDRRLTGKSRLMALTEPLKPGATEIRLVACAADANDNNATTEATAVAAKRHSIWRPVIIAASLSSSESRPSFCWPAGRQLV